jgi:valyl-tRNA synthetase
MVLKNYLVIRKVEILEHRYERQGFHEDWYYALYPFSKEEELRMEKKYPTTYREIYSIVLNTDIEKQYRERNKKLDKLSNQINKLKEKLYGVEFIYKAPENVVLDVYDNLEILYKEKYQLLGI